jgi:UDP-glucose 4-epimerase
MHGKDKGTVLVTGGAGYIGSHVNKKLHRRGWNTIVYDNLSLGNRSAVRWGDFVLGDLADKEQLRLVFRRFPIDAVMHFAASAYVGESVLDPGKYCTNNVANTVNLLETMREFSCRPLVFSSTCSIYGTPSRVPITEDLPQNPINPYGRSKLMIEWMLADYSQAYGMTYAALRYFNAAGADPEGEIGETHHPETHLIPLVLTAASTGQAARVFGDDYPTPDGTCVRDYIHVTDLADAHISALDHLLAGNAGDVFNLGTGRGYSVKEVIDCAARVTGKNIPAVISGRRAGDPAELVADFARASAVLGFTAKLSRLETIIETAWKWHSR